MWGGGDNGKERGTDGWEGEGVIKRKGLWREQWRAGGEVKRSMEGSIDNIQYKRFTASTHTCTMIPFELYSLRRASEKWDSNFCRRVER